MHGRFADNPAMLIQQDNRRLQVDLSGMSLDDLQDLRRSLQGDASSEYTGGPAMQAIPERKDTAV